MIDKIVQTREQGFVSFKIISRFIRLTVQKTFKINHELSIALINIIQEFNIYFIVRIKIKSSFSIVNCKKE